MPSDNILEISGLTVKFDNTAAVNNVDMNVACNSIVGLVGESGSGKSTLVSAVIGLLPNSANISHGNILFEGNDLTALPADQFQALRGSHISMVSQDPQSALNPVLTIEQHLTDIQYRDAINENQKREHAIEALKSVHMPDPEARLSMYPHELSGGQKQRVSIAMAVMMKPKLLIADEPTTALDATLEVEIIELLKELQSSVGCAMIFVTHHLGVVASLCNDVVVMCNGKVEEAGDVHSVFHFSKNQYTQNLLRCDPAQIEEKCRRLPTMSAPDFKVIESKESAKHRIVQNENPILQITNLEVTFRKPFSLSKFFNPQQSKDIKAVDKASIHLYRGETLAIVGESGSGKTTLIRAILRLVEAQSGSINFSGNSVLEANKTVLRKIRTEVALVFQDPVGSLSPRMTISTSLIEALNQESRNVADVDEEVARLLQLVGLPDEFLRRYPHELSGGQARRVCIARALAQSPKMLIADEPTAGLDVSIQGEILNLLTELQENLLLPILVVTHNLNVVRHVSDRMVIMYRGKIVEEGLTEKIFSDPKHDYTRHLLDANLHPLPKH